MINNIDNGTPLKVCFFGTYRENYVRNQVILNSLRIQGVDVYVCHSELWHGVEDRIQQASGGWIHPSFLFRVIQAYWRLWRKHSQIPSYDIMLIGYPGQLDIFLGRLLTWWRCKPVALDILMSIHLIAEERGLTKKSPLTGKLLFWLEKVGLNLPDLMLADTLEYQHYYCSKYSLSSDKFQQVPLGVDDRIFHPYPNINPPSEYFRVLYYGTFIPLHGVETIVRAAAELRDHKHIKFDFFGEGQERKKAEILARDLKLNNTRFLGWMSKNELPIEIAQSHVCLGVFGVTKQSLITVQNKIWESMAVGRPVITGDARTIRETLVNKKHVYLIHRDNPTALANAILELAESPELWKHISQSSYERSKENTMLAIGKKTEEALKTLLK